VGSETKIPYENDYDFYLERLYKCSTWAIEMMNFFNVGVFGNNKACEIMSSESMVPSAPPRTWEDDFLNNLDNAGPPVQTTSNTNTSVHLNFGNTSSVPGSSPPCSLQHSSPSLFIPHRPILLDQARYPTQTCLDHLTYHLARSMIPLNPLWQLPMPWYQSTTILALHRQYHSYR
jgi:hypothetical protein